MRRSDCLGARRDRDAPARRLSLVTLTGERRYVIALDPKTGELLWSFTEPNTHRYEDSMRKVYGKGVAYAEVPGRGGGVPISSPGLFLWAFDADTGQPIAIPGFSQTGGETRYAAATWSDPRRLGRQTRL